MADDKSIDLREMARKAQDRLRVLNPTDEDYNVAWDGYLHSVPAKREAIFPRYLANKYIQEMTDKILVKAQDDAVRLENEKRKELGKEEMEKWQEQHTFEDKYRFAHGVANPEARKQVMKSLYGGLVEEYGLNISVQNATKSNLSPSDEQLLDEIQSETLITTDVSEKAPIEELEDKNVFQLQKMAREKGLEVDKTDKKDELIAKISQ
jgi:ABC-type Fe3+-citrate transport system substrate-binding protein